MNITRPTVHATVVAQELADLPTQTDRQMRIHAELMKYAKHPEEAVIFSVALQLALLAILDATVKLAGDRATYNPSSAARHIKRGLRRNRRK